jgi:Sec23/Sec24 trunk domain/Sec23/Sec24 zinc finger
MLNFASKYVLNRSSDEELSEFEQNLRWSASDCDEELLSEDDRFDDDEEDEQVRVKRVQKTNTNLVAIDLGSLSEQGRYLFSGDPQQCEQCAAYFSRFSERVDDNQHWRCEFCSHLNSVDLDDDEVPTDDVVEFIVESSLSSASSSSSSSTPTAGADSILFVIDTSASMCCSQAVSLSEGERLKGGAKGMHSELAQFIEAGAGGEQQLLPGEAANVTYVSRLQCVQAAIADALEQLKRKSPQARAGLVTFASTVQLIGDGTQAPRTLAGDELLGDAERLRAEGAKFAELGLSASVGDTQAQLTERVFALQEEGVTALGSAMVAAAGMLSASGGGRMVLCTDGRCNVGLGSLEGDDDLDDGAEAPSAAWYGALAASLANEGISVNVLSIKGTDCKLERLASVSDATGGTVNTVEPTKLREEFAAALDNDLIATHCTVKVLLHRALYLHSIGSSFGGTDKSGESGGGASTSLNIGPVTSSTKISLRYGVVKKKEQVSEEKNGAASSTSTLGEAPPSAVPFQVIVNYVRVSDGCKLVRVLSAQQVLTTDRSEAEAAADVDVLAHAAKQVAAELALEGGYTQSRAMLQQAGALLKRVARTQGGGEQQQAYVRFKKEAFVADNLLFNEQRREEHDGFAGLSDSDHSDSDLDDNSGSDDDDDDDERRVKAAAAKAKKGKKKRKALSTRSNRRNDKTANLLYRLKK